MKEAALWKFISKNLKTGFPVALLAVLDSDGSSPGRAGFKMALAVNGEMNGSIGGGIMEHKLVEIARKNLLTNNFKPVLKKQIHSKKAPQNQSGMICSGEQTVAIYLISPEQLSLIQTIETAISKQEPGRLILAENGIGFEKILNPDKRIAFFWESDTVWRYEESLQYRDLIYIIGGGHVGLALSQLMWYLNFDVHLFDDRPELNTFQENQFTTQKTIVNYPEIGSHIPEDPEAFVVIMTFGYRPDSVVLRQLLGKKFKYLGLMGSQAKVAQMFKELRAEGYNEEDLQTVFAPVGLPIKSKTPEEIAVSIAAQIIQIKNQ